MKPSSLLPLLPLTTASLLPRQSQRDTQQAQRLIAQGTRQMRSAAQSAQSLSQSLANQDEEASIQGAAKLEQDLTLAKQTLAQFRQLGAEKFQLQAFIDLQQQNAAILANARKNQQANNN
ncbi:hypothetical protein CDD81_6638 [Ophiocordyceps australis]|uniref:Uncharacterized protein n=1 Tax=Ophiocordyceps australis TaxID=1399860 RepID=A0A2C5XHI6_9HYPO|nr:hypothetical protein CDD81_6638 [Ophiocordyceps australis]